MGVRGPRLRKSEDGREVGRKEGKNSEGKAPTEMQPWHMLQRAGVWKTSSFYLSHFSFAFRKSL